MPPATKDQQEMYDRVVALAPYRPKREGGAEELTVVEVDEVPEEDSQGRRRVDGWKASWEGVVDESELAC